MTNRSPAWMVTGEAHEMSALKVEELALQLLRLLVLEWVLQLV